MQDNNTKQIQAVVDHWVKSIQQKDINGILQNHSPDILMFDVPLPLQSKGLSEYRATWELFFQYSSGGDDSFQLEELHITAGDTVAFCTALIKLAKSAKPQCRLTLGLKKMDNRWLIVHEHHSAPHEVG